MQGHIAIFDTSISSLNVGDQIIMDAVNNELFPLFSSYQLIHIPSHEKISKTSLSIIRRSKNSIVGGSNILSSYMNKYPQWKLDALDAFFIKDKVTLLGVGWRQYQGTTNWYTKILLSRILNKNYIHSVRDSYTEKKLHELGFNNVLNTGCPTMWRLTQAHCSIIPMRPANSVIFTLTDYDKKKDLDERMIEILKSNYRKLFFWVQGNKDLAYFKSFGSLTEGIQIVPPNLKSYDVVLQEETIDYVGTRLHAGIRALQKGRRSIIIGIDNRAEEKRKDFNLPVLDRTEIDRLEKFVREPLVTEIKLPVENIDRWKNQFNR